MIRYWTSVHANLGARVARGLGRRGSARGVRHGVDSERNSLAADESPGHEAPRPRLSPSSLLALAASYPGGAHLERLAGEDDR